MLYLVGSFRHTKSSVYSVGRVAKTAEDVDGIHLKQIKVNISAILLNILVIIDITFYNLTISKEKPLDNILTLVFQLSHVCILTS